MWIKYCIKYKSADPKKFEMSCSVQGLCRGLGTALICQNCFPYPSLWQFFLIFIFFIVAKWHFSFELIHNFTEKICRNPSVLGIQMSREECQRSLLSCTSAVLLLRPHLLGCWYNFTATEIIFLCVSYHYANKIPTGEVEIHEGPGFVLE